MYPTFADSEWRATLRAEEVPRTLADSCARGTVLLLLLPPLLLLLQYPQMLYSEWSDLTDHYEEPLVNVIPQWV